MPLNETCSWAQSENAASSRVTMTAPSTTPSWTTTVSPSGTKDQEREPTSRASGGASSASSPAATKGPWRSMRPGRCSVKKDTTLSSSRTCRRQSPCHRANARSSTDARVPAKAGCTRCPAAVMTLLIQLGSARIKFCLRVSCSPGGASRAHHDARPTSFYPTGIALPGGAVPTRKATTMRLRLVVVAPLAPSSWVHRQYESSSDDVVQLGLDGGQRHVRAGRQRRAYRRLDQGRCSVRRPGVARRCRVDRS